MLTRSYLNPGQEKLLAYSPMLHARLFAQSSKMREKHFQPTRSGMAKGHEPGPPFLDPTFYLDRDPDIDRPLIVQFCANDPDELLAAARFVEPFCDAVDLNLGCPQGIARKGRYGAFLQEDQDLVYRLINKLHKELDIPVTAKIRVLESRERTLAYAKNVLSAGASILTVHGRQRDQKGHNTGLADWSVIRYLRDHLPRETVLFANGNVLCHDDIAKCLEKTGADGVMSAEGNLHDPSIFAGPPQDPHDPAYWRGRDGRGGYRIDAVFRHYLSIIYRYVLETPEPQRSPLFCPLDASSDQLPAPTYPDPDDEQPASKRRKRNKTGYAVSQNLCSMQAHLFSLLRPLVVSNTQVRDALAKTQVGVMQSFERALHLTEAAVREGLLDYARNPEKYETALCDISSPTLDADANIDREHASIADDQHNSRRTASECKRPWWVCQPYVRPLPLEAIENGALTLSKKDDVTSSATGPRTVRAGSINSSREKSLISTLVEASAVTESSTRSEEPVCG